MESTWFTGHTGNESLENLSDIESTLLQGGWYRANLIPGKLTLLNIDSLPFNRKNDQSTDEESEAQLNWLEEQLKNAGPDEKFFTMMHIYETAGWWDTAFA